MAYEHIKKLLEDNGEDQTDLARLIGRTNAVVTNLFNGDRSLQVEEVEKISHRYRVSTDFVLYGREKYENGLRDSEIALVDAFKDIIQVLALSNPEIPAMLRNAFSYQRAEYGDRDLKGAVQIMEILGKFVGEPSLGTEQTLIRRLLQIAPLGSA